MKPYPHDYSVYARAGAIGSVSISGAGLPPIATAPPPQFGGPEGTWSPETLLCAAVADCFILTFRAVARAAHCNWITLDCRVEGVLERVRDTTQFTRFTTAARLTVPPGSDPTMALRLLRQAEHGCLIANSLRGQRTLSAEIVIANAVTDAHGSTAESRGESAGQPRRHEPQSQPAIGQSS